MNTKILNKLKIKKQFKSEASRFQLFTALKVTAICILVSFFVSYLVWMILAMNNIFFEANGYLGIAELRTAYYDFILSTTIEQLPVFLGFCVMLFFAGIYMSKILLRPFDISTALHSWKLQSVFREHFRAQKGS